MRQRIVILALSCTNCSRHQLFWCLLEALGGLHAHVLRGWLLCGSTEHTAEFCTCSIQLVWCVLGARCITMGRFYWRRAGCLHGAREADLTLPRAVGLVPNRNVCFCPRDPEPWCLEGFCSAWRDFCCLPMQQNSTARLLIHLCSLSVPGLLGGSLQESIIMPSRLLMNALLEFTSEDCKCGE